MPMITSDPSLGKGIPSASSSSVMPARTPERRAIEANQEQQDEIQKRLSALGYWPDEKHRVYWCSLDQYPGHYIVSQVGGLIANVTLDKLPGFQAAMDAITRLQELEPYWDGDEARAIDWRCIKIAQELLEKIAKRVQGWRAPSIFPTTDGGVLFQWSTDQLQAVLEILPDNPCVFVQTKRRGEDAKSGYENIDTAATWAARIAGVAQEAE